MAIREDAVASAVQFLQDPSVASSSVENRVAFMRSKNLTQEEIDAALTRAAAHAPPPPPGASYPSNAPPQYYQPYPSQAWQPPPPAPRRDWRDWFIVATVVGGVSYGLYSLGKRYVYPLVAPPTPDRLEQDKKSIEEQFDKAFALVEQLSKDTEELKAAELQRTERLDTALTELEKIMGDLKAANRRREDDGQRLRDEVQSLKDAIPKALNNQKDLTDNRLKEINGELASLKTLVSQRVNTSTSAASPASASNYSRPTVGNASTSGAADSRSGTPGAENKEEGSKKATVETPKKGAGSSFGFSRGSGQTNGSAGAKASIPAWQMAMANPSATGSSHTGEANGDGSSNSSP